MTKSTRLFLNLTTGAAMLAGMGAAVAGFVEGSALLIGFACWLIGGACVLAVALDTVA